MPSLLSFHVHVYRRRQLKAPLSARPGWQHEDAQAWAQLATIEEETAAQLGETAAQLATDAEPQEQHDGQQDGQDGQAVPQQQQDGQDGQDGQCRNNNWVLPHDWWKTQPWPYLGSDENPWAGDYVCFVGDRSFWKYYDGNPDSLDALDNASSPFRGRTQGAPIIERPPRWLGRKIGVKPEQDLQYLRKKCSL